MSSAAPTPEAQRLLTRAATPRALLTGIAASVFVNFASPYTESVGFSNFSWSYLPEGGAFPLMLLLPLNAIIARIRPRWALTVPELLLVFVMALAANCTSIFLMYFLCSAIVSPHYFSSPENRWDEALIPYLKPSLIVSDDRNAVFWFYEGIPPGQPIPWSDWAAPLAAWMPFLVSLLVASFAMVALLRRQWIEHERLSYPLMRLPLELLGRGPTDHGHGAITRSRGFWLAVLIPFVFAVLDLMRGLMPSFPALPVDHLGSVHFGVLRPGPHFPDLQLKLSFLALSSAFFVPTDVLFGVWSLYLFVKLVQEPIVNRLGLGAGSAGMFVWGQASTSWQSFGAFTVLVISTLLNARARLGDVWRAARRPTHDPEAMSARTALTSLAVALAVMAAWLRYSGMPWIIVPLFIILVMAMYLGLARIICQAGIFYLVPPMIAQNPIIYALGPDAIGKQGMISLGLSYAWHGDVQTVMSGLAAQSMKIEERAPFGRGELSLAVLLSAFVGLIVAPLGIILTGYPKGALTWSTWVYKGWGPNTYGQVLGQISAGPQRQYFNGLYYCIGFLAMIGLTALRNTYPWWPLHPLGLAAVSSFTIYNVYIAFLLGWILKVGMLHWGGFKAYRTATPFFIGLGVGHYLGRALMLIGYTVLGIGWRL